MRYQNPVIVVPGITSTTLVDDYPLRADELWSMVINKDYERIALHPDDLRFEALEPAHVVPRQLFPIYEDLIRALRFELSPRADCPTPVFAFPYDWRMDIAASAGRLGAFVEEVIARTRLLHHYDGADDIKVDLVGHSMGGLLICEYLALAGRKSQVGKVVTIGTPFKGSVEAIVKIATGMSLLSGSEPREREREAARVTPALYQLFPSYEDSVLDRSGRPVDMFDAKNMQASILSSLTEFVRMYSVGTRSADRAAKAHSILNELLAKARRHRATVDGFKPSRGGIRRDDWLAIVGMGQKTRIQMTVDDPGGMPRFEISDKQFVDELQSRPGSYRTGDGTVPLAGAIPEFLPRSALVAVTEKDLGLFEVRDRLLVEFGGLHGLLPRLNLVQRLVTRHLAPGFRGDIGGMCLPGVRKWNPPISGLA